MAQVMGILNVTPDSFSDGGRLWSGEGGGGIDVERALDHARALLAEGAALLDLGAESTRPAGAVYGAGARAVPADEELRRLLPVLERLRAETDVPLSVDTRKAEVARAALAAGADLVNDVEALADPALAETVAAAGCPVVLMHSRGDFASTMQHQARYADLLGEVRDELAAALARAEAAGVDRAQVVLDPGIGFAKGPRHNLLLGNRAEHNRFAYVAGESFVQPGVFRVTVERHGAPAAALRFEWLDRVRPTRPGLRVRVLRGRRVRLTWDPSTDRGSGMKSYAVVVDGNVVLRSLRADPLLVPEARLRLSRGTHRIAVFAFDRAGNRGPSATRRIRIR